MKVHKCDVCGVISEVRPLSWGAFVTTDGVKEACSAACMVAGLSQKDVCTLRTLEAINIIDPTKLLS